GSLDGGKNWDLDTVYTLEFTRDGATNELKCYDSKGDLLDSKSVSDHNAAVGDGASVIPAILFSGVTANISNIVYTEDGTVKFDSSTLTGSFSPFSPGWEYAAAPVVKNVKVDNTTGKITATVDGEIGVTGAASIEVNLIDKDGNVVDTVVKNEFGKDTHDVEFEPEASGDYTIVAVGKRPNETIEHKSEAASALGFVLPMAKVEIASVTNKGNGNVQVKWREVPEATSYEVYQDGTLIATVEGLSTTVTGLTIGQKYSFTVRAISNKTSAGEMSDANEVTVVAEEQAEWNFSAYGGSSISGKAENNGYSGNANDGQVTVWSLNGSGKIYPNGVDQVAFYYTAVPVDTNFTLKAKIHVDKWTLSNGQEGFGIMAADHVGTHGDLATVWNNAYMAIGTKIEYTWDAAKKDVALTGTKYSMKLGLGLLAKTGVTKNDDINASDVPAGFKYGTTPLETSAAEQGLLAGTYNIIGNATKEVEGTIANNTDFILEIQKNNTGYFITYYDEAGNVIKKIKNYDPNALSMIDEENVYVGFFASRNVQITASDIQFSTIAAKDDAPAEERPITYVEPVFQVQSGTVANSEYYEVAMYSNVSGTARIRVNGNWVAENIPVEAEKRTDHMVVLEKETNEIKVEFLPDATQDLGEYTQLANADRLDVKFEVKIKNEFANLKEIYVSPDGRSNARGTKDDPVDVYTAVSAVKPGQTIVVMEGEYLLFKTIKIERGMDGTAEQNIRMIADPEAISRPVFNFQGICPGMIMAGDYWYFYGFDVTKSQNAQKGIQVSGNNNTLDNIMAYHNGNTGIQISRYLGTDEFEDWPANNLILNCTSYGNADAGYEDADGFAAKLTVGEGNVFDGCIAYNNADDGWDLYAKVETGPIGKVVIKNSVAFANGYLEDGTDAGNGNGFKMGGESLTGYHTLINSYSFFNKAKGIDCNSCPDIQVYNSISYNNESYNVAFYTNAAKNTDYYANGVISFKDSTSHTLFPGYAVKGTDVAEQLKPVGNQDETKIKNETNYYWDGSKSVNKAGTQVTADWFESLVFTGIGRNADGTINMNGFLQLTDVAPAGVGAVPGGTPSAIGLTDKFKVEVTTTIPESVLTEEVKKATGCNTVDELVLYLKTQITENEAARRILSDLEGSVVYEVKILVSIDGINWELATEENFPAKGVDVYLPYPEGISRNKYDFVVGHLITMNCNGQQAGTLEFFNPKETSNALKVHVMSASPFAVAWAEEIYEDGVDGNGVKSVNTGDTTPLMPLAIIMLVSAGICVAYVFRRKRA
ncbi:MAG: hypothetical protein PUF12_00710, partial [Thermoflexaceae bacterium]|nr:hypothetical protein [Thermoflexaceae bacterium]